ncbi:MAG: Hsp20/alpha crystallin family protein [Halohasta sp.]
MLRPYTPFDDIDQFFGRFGRGFDSMWSTEAGSMAVDVASDDGAFVLTADLPGFDREDIELTVDDRAVTISAEHRHEIDESNDADADADGTYLHRERRTASIQRRLTLPESVDEDAASASYHNGVLTVTLPKESAVAIEDGRRIDIE